MSVPQAFSKMYCVESFDIVFGAIQLSPQILRDLSCQKPNLWLKLFDGSLLTQGVQLKKKILGLFKLIVVS